MAAGQADPAPATPAAAIASAWGVTLTAQPSEPVAPTDHVVVVGPSTIASRSLTSGWLKKIGAQLQLAPA